MPKFDVHGFFTVEAEDADGAGDVLHMLMPEFIADGEPYGVKGYEQGPIYHVGGDDE